MSTNKPVPVRAATWYRTSLALGLATLALVSLLQSCGGQSGGSGPSGNSTPTADEIKRNSILANTANTGLTELRGLYKGNLINTTDEFLILVVPDTGNNVLAYAWYRKANLPAQPYHGPLTLGTQGAASSTANTWKIGEGSSTLPATATITGASLSAMIADISITRSNVAAKSQMVASALPSNEYVFNDAPTGLSDPSGTPWNGSWSSRGNNTGSSLVFDSNGSANVTQSITVEGCTYAANQQTWRWSAHPSGKNVFNVQLDLVSGGLTSCYWAGKPLSGIAIVSKQGAAYQLDMMLLDVTGAGISYRGTR